MNTLDQQELDKICRDYDLSLVIVFGSQAKEVAPPESDLDLAVWIDRKGFDTDFQLALLRAFLNLLKRDKLDLVILNHSDPLLQFEVASKGGVLYEKKKGQFKIFQTYALKRNDDGKRFYELNTKYVENFLRGVRSDVKQRCHPPKIGRYRRVH